MEGQTEKGKDIADSNQLGRIDKLILNSFPKLQSSEARNQPDLNNLKIVTYNCKNMDTSTYAIDQLSKTTDIIMVQEH